MPVLVQMVGESPARASRTGVLHVPDVVHGGAGRTEGDDHVFPAGSACVDMVCERCDDVVAGRRFSLSFLFRSPKNVDALLGYRLDDVIRNRVFSEIGVHAGHHEDGCVAGSRHRERHHQRSVLEPVKMAGHDVPGGWSDKNGVGFV